MLNRQAAWRPNNTHRRAARQQQLRAPPENNYPRMLRPLAPPSSARVILTRQLATRSHVFTNVRLDKSRDAKTSLLLATAMNHETPRRLCCSHQQFKTTWRRNVSAARSSSSNHVTPRRLCCLQQQFKPQTPRYPFTRTNYCHTFGSMTCASCSSPAIRAQEPSNHWSQQLPEVPPTNSDDTITIAPRPPTDLTTETEPRIESPNISQLLNTATAHAMPPINLTTSSDYSRQELNDRNWGTIHSVCKPSSVGQFTQVKTWPHPTKSHEQLDSDARWA